MVPLRAEDVAAARAALGLTGKGRRSGGAHAGDAAAPQASAQDAGPQQPADVDSSADEHSSVGVDFASVSEEEYQSLLKRLWKGDELIRQLKHIVKAQHAKIEELRERLDVAESGVRVAMREQERGDLERLGEENEELRRAANQLRAEKAKLKAETETLRKANRRIKAMLAQEPGEGPFTGCSVMSAAMVPSVDCSLSRSVMEGVSKECPPPCATPGLEASVTPLGAAGSPPSTARSSKLGAARSSSRPSAASKGRGGCSSLPPFPKASRLVSSIPLFWRDMESPSTVLHALQEVSERLLSDRPSTVLTIYLVDPFVRLESLGGVEAKGSPALFYLGQGRTELQVFPARRSPSGRPEPPRFGDLQALPYRTQSALAVAVQMPNSHRTLAVVQASAADEPRGGTGGSTATKAAPTPRVLRRHCDLAEPAEIAGFTDSQLAYMQLVCSVAAGCLFYIERLGHGARMLERQRACAEVAVAVNKARSLADFEQRIKHLLGPFFSANIVRVLFFDADSQKLLTPCAQMRRKDYQSLSIEKGVVGLCAKRRIVVSVPNISQHPFVDAVADGLQRGGRPVAASSAMLCGPLLVEADEGGDAGGLLGVVQLLERKKRAGGAAVSGEFSPEEQELFRQLLQVFAHAGWRALKAQELAARLEGSPATLLRLLMG